MAIDSISLSYVSKEQKAGIVVMGGGSTVNADGFLQATNSVEKLDGQSDLIVAWGGSNKDPQDWEAMIEENDTLRGAVELATDQLYGGGVEYGCYKIIDGKSVFVTTEIPEIDNFLQHPITQSGLEQLAKDIVVHGFPAPELLFSNGKISAIHGQPVANLRWFAQSNKGYIEKAAISRNWALGHRSDNELTKTLNVIDPLVHPSEIVSSLNLSSAIFKNPTASTRTYYPISMAYTAQKSGWLDIDNKGAKLVKSILDNSMFIQRIIYIRFEWFQQKHGDAWTKGSDDEKIELMKIQLKEITEQLHGTTNAGKNVMVPFIRVRDVEVKAWEIEEVENKPIDKSLLEVMTFAKDRVMTAVGVDPTILGQGKSSSLGAGSGSDKREAFNISASTQTRLMKRWLAAFNFSSRVNGWKIENKYVEFRSIQPYMQTLNQVTPSQRQTALK